MASFFEENVILPMLAATSGGIKAAKLHVWGLFLAPATEVDAPAALANQITRSFEKGPLFSGTYHDPIMSWERTGKGLVDKLTPIYRSEGTCEAVAAPPALFWPPVGPLATWDPSSYKYFAMRQFTLKKGMDMDESEMEALVTWLASLPHVEGVMLTRRVDKALKPTNSFEFLLGCSAPTTIDWTDKQATVPLEDLKQCTVCALSTTFVNAHDAKDCPLLGEASGMELDLKLLHDDMDTSKEIKELKKKIDLLDGRVKKLEEGKGKKKPTPKRKRGDDGEKKEEPKKKKAKKGKEETL
ncbi:hypothetical protein AX17_005510 [Amanita inopinata Kibby_2008]|nr:hypothetical protein AX17_005510 [Amanita inopinata Kibby_2008]